MVDTPRPIRSRSDDPDDEDRGPAPPPSVREVMGRVDHKPEPETLPRRPLEVGDELWEVTQIGSTRSGEPGDSGAPLLLLRFSRDDGDVVREGWAVGHRLPEVSEFDLVELLERAREIGGPDD